MTTNLHSQYTKAIKQFFTKKGFLNSFIFLIPIFIIGWVQGAWVSFFVIIAIYQTLEKDAKNYIFIIKSYYFNKPYSLIFLTYLAFFILSLSSVLMLNSKPSSLENALVFLFWFAISPIVLIIKPSSRVLGLGCFIAVILALLISIYQFYTFNVRPYGTYGTGVTGSGAIKLGDLSLLIGVLSFMLLKESQFKKTGISAVLIGITVCLFAGARGGVLAASLSSVVWFVFLRKNKYSLIAYVTTLVSSALLLFVLNKMMNGYIEQRILETTLDMLSVHNNRLDTSIGVRLQLWKAALVMFQNNPLWGVGLNNFKNELYLLSQQGVVSNMAANFSHAHNEYFCSLATGGIIGFLITCSLFFVPIAVFGKDYQSSVWARAGFWGATFMSFFALTDCMFDRRMTVSFFAILISICIAGNIAERQKKQNFR